MNYTLLSTNLYYSYGISLTALPYPYIYLFSFLDFMRLTLIFIYISYNTYILHQKWSKLIPLQLA